MKDQTDPFKAISVSKRNTFEVVAGLKGALAFSRRKGVDLTTQRLPSESLGCRISAWLEKLHRLSLLTPFRLDDGTTISRWSQFIPQGLSDAVYGLQTSDEIARVCISFGTDPHQQLLFAFLQNVCVLEEKISQLESRYFDFYFESILGETVLPCKAEKAHLLVSLTDQHGNPSEGVVEKGQRFIGKGLGGQPLYFVNTRETFINSSLLAHVSFLKQQVGEVEGLFQREYPVEVATPYLKQPVDSSIVDYRHRCGSLQLVHPQLNLASGDRKIRLTFSNDGLSFDNESIRQIAPFIEISYFSDQQWLPLPLLAKKDQDPTGYWHLDGACILLRIPESAPSCQGKVRLAVNDKQLHDLAGHALVDKARIWIREFNFDCVDVVTVTKRLKGGVMRTPSSDQGLEGPTLPFAPPIAKNAEFSLILNGVNPLGLESLNLAIAWTGLPDTPLEEYYHAYRQYFSAREVELSRRDDFKRISSVGKKPFSVNWTLYALQAGKRVGCIGAGRDLLFNPEQSGQTTNTQHWSLPLQSDSEVSMSQSLASIDSVEVVFSLTDDSDFLHQWQPVLAKAASQEFALASSSLFTNLKTSKPVPPPPEIFVPSIDSLDIRIEGRCKLRFKDVKTATARRGVLVGTPIESSSHGLSFDIDDTLQSVIQPEQGLVPVLRNASMLLFQFQTLSVGNCLNIYINVAENSQVKAPESCWQLWTDSGWSKVKVLRDETRNLLSSGIISLWIPDNAQVIGAYYQIAFVTEEAALKTVLNAISLNGLLVELDTEQHRWRQWDCTLPAGSISEAEPGACQCIGAVMQPYPGFSGRGAESTEDARRRVQSQIQYKSRLLVPSSYEDRIIYRFPELLAVKCISDSFSRFRNQVRLLVLPKPQDEINSNTNTKTNGSDVNQKLCLTSGEGGPVFQAGDIVPLPGYLKSEIEQECANFLPLGANLIIETPVIALRRYHFALVLAGDVGQNYDYYRGQTLSYLKQKLNPYSQFYCDNIGLSPRIPAGLVRSQLEHLPYIQAVLDVRHQDCEPPISSAQSVSSAKVEAVPSTRAAMDVRTESEANARLAVLYVFDEASSISWFSEDGETLLDGDPLAQSDAGVTSGQGPREGELSLDDLLPLNDNQIADDVVVPHTDSVFEDDEEEESGDQTSSMTVGEGMGILGPSMDAAAQGLGSESIGKNFVVR